MTKLVDIEGIGASYATKLTAAGVRSLEDLLLKGHDPKGRSALVDASSVSQKLVRKTPSASQVSSWVAQAKNLPRAIHY